MMFFALALTFIVIHFWFELHFVPSNLQLHSHDISFVNVCDSFILVIMLNKLGFKSFVLFGIDTFLDKLLRVFELLTHLSKITTNG